MHPFLDTSKLSDEEILEKIGKAYIMLNAQIDLGHTPTVISIKEVIESLEQERANRMQRQMHDEAKKKKPNDLDPIEIGKLED